MRSKVSMIMTWALIVSLATTSFAQGRGGGAAPAQPQAAPAEDFVKTLVGRLDLERYKATLKGLTQFGDRRQGTERNRKAVDWIEAQLKSYGCATDRIKYDYNPAPANPQRGAEGGARGQGQRGGGGGQRGTPAPLRSRRKRTRHSLTCGASPSQRKRQSGSGCTHQRRARRRG